MTTPNPTPKPSATELMLRSPDPRNAALAYSTADRMRRNEILREAAKDIANLSWGRNMSEHAQYAVARWSLEAGIDPARHIDILGGRIYVNAQFYLDGLAAMPEFHYDEWEVIAPLDTRTISAEVLGAERAAALVREQQEINARRLALQMQYSVPQDINEFPATAAAVLVTLHFRDGTKVAGVNWAGSRGRTKGQRGGAFDPVGDVEPVKTALTRALRKAALKKVPVWFKQGDHESRFMRAEEAIASDRADLRSHGLDPDEPRPMAPEGSVMFKRAMQGDLDKEHMGAKLKAPIHPPEDPYAPGAQTGTHPSVEVYCPACGFMDVVRQDIFEAEAVHCSCGERMERVPAPEGATE